MVVFESIFEMETDKIDVHKDWIKITWPKPAGKEEYLVKILKFATNASVLWNI